MVEKSLALFKLQITRLENSFLNLICDKQKLRKPERWYYFEGMLSQAWQAWCNFSRTYCMTVVSGHTFRSGSKTSRLPWAISNDATLYNLTMLSQRRKLDLNYISNFPSRSEITWGDISKLLDIFIKLNMTYQRKILIFPEALVLKDFQNVRNYCSHITHDNQNNMIKLSSNYIGTRIQHPTDLMLWETKKDSEFAFIHWLRKAEFIAEQLTAQ